MKRICNYAFASICLFCLVACQKSDPADTVDLLNVVRDGATIPAYIYGNTGSDVFMILLHGGPGGSGLEYRGGSFTKMIEEDYAVVYTDQRGQGMSQGNLEVSDFTPSNVAKDVHALALSLREKYGQDISLFLMGHSWGGTLGTAVMINEDFAQQYKGWIEVDGAHDMPRTFLGGLDKLDTVATEQILAQSDTVFWLDVKAQVADVDRTLDIDNEGVLTQNMLGFSGEEKLATSDVINPTDPEAIASALVNNFFINNSVTSFFTGNVTNGAFFENNLLEYNATGQLKNITAPTLLMWGKYDLVVTDEIGFTALDSIGSADKALHIFEKSGHSPFITEPVLFTEIVLEFIDRLK